MTIRAVVFDMDGVLIDAKEWHYEALNRALGLFGFEISRSDHLERFDGLPTSRKLEMLSRDRGLPRGLHAFINELKQQYTVELVHTRCNPKFAHQYALANLKRAGMKLGVASNSIADSVSLMMAKSRLDRYLDIQLSATDVTAAKPDPEIYLTAMNRLGVSAQETLIVEDNDHGIQAARASGGHVLEVASVDEVNLDNIRRMIDLVESQS